MNKEENIKEIVKNIAEEINDKEFLTYGEIGEWEQYLTDIIDIIIKKENKYLQQENKQLKERIDNLEFLLLSQGKELKELYLIIDKAIEYLEQPNRDNFDFSKAILLEILKGEENE